MSDCVMIDFPRERLVEITEDLLAAYGPKAPWLADEVRDVARTARFVSADWSGPIALGVCGCLIGTVRLRHGLQAYQYLSADDDVPGLDAEESIGEDFYHLLADEIGTPVWDALKAMAALCDARWEPLSYLVLKIVD